jgi:hypothetical protein
MKSDDVRSNKKNKSEGKRESRTKKSANERDYGTSFAKVLTN